MEGKKLKNMATNCQEKCQESEENFMNWKNVNIFQNFGTFLEKKNPNFDEKKEKCKTG